MTAARTVFSSCDTFVQVTGSRSRWGREASMRSGTPTRSAATVPVARSLGSDREVWQRVDRAREAVDRQLLGARAGGGGLALPACAPSSSGPSARCGCWRPTRASQSRCAGWPRWGSCRSRGHSTRRFCSSSPDPVRVPPPVDARGVARGRRARRHVAARACVTQGSRASRTRLSGVCAAPPHRPGCPARRGRAATASPACTRASRTRSRAGRSG